jgi:transaldolase
VKEIVRRKLSKYLEESTEVISTLYSHDTVRGIIDAGKNEGLWSGVEVVRKIVGIFRKYEFRTEVIAASMRHPRQVREVAEAGADIVTVPFGVLQAMLRHYKTEEGVKRFSIDAAQAKYGELFK